MLAHHMKIAARQLRRSPASALLNVVTLSLGLACFVAASTIVGFWNRAEQSFANANRTYVVTGVSWSGVFVPFTSSLVADQLLADFPGIEAVARVTSLGEPLRVSLAGRSVQLEGYGADADLLRIFDLPFLAGNALDALRRPASVVLTRAAAIELYGDDDVVGRPLLLGDTTEAAVTGVVDAIPEPSHMGRSGSAVLPFEMLVSRDVYEGLARGNSATGRSPSWTEQTDLTYVLLPADGSLTFEQLRDELDRFVARHAPAELVEAGAREIEQHLLPVTKLLETMASETVFLREAGGSAPAVLLVLGSLVLLIACMNYANLAIGRAALGGRDVGVRRALGATRVQVVAQYLVDAALHATAALLLALVVVRMVSPVLENTLGIDVGAAMVADFRAYMLLISILLTVALLAGAYPAYLLSGVRPVTAIRGGMSRLGPPALANVLIGTQFAAASFLLIAVSIIVLQHRALESSVALPGSDPLLIIENDTRRTGVDQGTLRSELLQLPQVRAATTAGFTPWRGRVGSPPPLARTPDRSTVPRPVRMYGVGSNFFSTLEIPVLAGGPFAAQEEGRAPTDGPARTPRVVVDRDLTEQLGFRSPDEAVGETLYMLWDEYEAGQPASPVEVIGVVEDRRLNVTTGLGPTSSIYGLSPTPLPVHLVRISASDVGGALAAIDTLWQRLAPSVPLERRFVSDDFEASFDSYAKIGQIFIVLAFLAFLIATFGLFAMSLRLANRRLREIAVRKTLGARRDRLVWMLLRWMSRPVLIANVAAMPLAFAFGRAYLSVFDQPVPMTPWPFLACLAFTLLLACATVGHQTWRAASVRPSDVLRSE
jgi:putative ABC transport system permease protein